MSGAASENERIVRLFYDLFAQGQMDQVAHLFSPEFLFVPAGKRSVLAGTRVGPQEILAFTERQMALTGATWIPRPYDILAGERHVAVLVTVTATRAGRSAHFRLVHVWRIEDGIARELRSYVDDQYAYDQFFSPELTVP
jgi:ketosteroid isomerase-like protein